MSGFRGTKGKLERKYVTGICIGIGTVGNFSQITANSILPETDKQYKKEKTEIEANMLLYSKAPEMLDQLNRIHGEIMRSDGVLDVEKWGNQIEQLIKSATEL